MKLSYRITWTTIAAAISIALFVRFVPMIPGLDKGMFGIPTGLAFLFVAVSVLLMAGLPMYVWVASRPAVHDRSELPGR